MPRPQAPVEVRFDPAEVRALVRDLKELEGGKKLQADLRKNLKAAAEPIKQQVKANASWSTRIPAAVAIGTAFTTKRTGIFLRVNAKKAPHARPLENDGRAGTFRHPTWGTEPWVSQPARPFFFNETASHMPEVEEAAGEAVEETARSAGFR
jgi:hypothetical protein